MVEHIVKAGECMASIAHLYGFSEPSAIYEHELNTSLRYQRPNMHLLMPNDKVIIPASEPKSLAIMPGKTTALIVKGKLAQLALRLDVFDGELLANHAFELQTINGIYSGTTNEQGEMTLMVDASVKTAKLIIFLDNEKRSVLQWPLEIGFLHASHHLSGVQARLNNLGYFCANEQGEYDDSTAHAIDAFSQDKKLTHSQTIVASSNLSSAFIDALQAAYGC